MKDSRIGVHGGVCHDYVTTWTSTR